MQKEVKFFMGMDVSKQWVDIALMPVIDHVKQPMLGERFDNNAAGLKALDAWLKSQQVSFDHNSLLVIENTGIYHRLVWQYCSAHNLPLYIGNATHIKYSFGIARGKSDVIDAQRLCTYACKHGEELKTTAPLDVVALQLKDLMTARARLLEQKNSIKVFLGELLLSNSKTVQALMEKTHKAALTGIEASLKEVERQICEMIKKHTAIKKNYDLLLSVPGIGHITAVYLICCTGNFGGKITGKQLACYAGVAPFGNSSGSSIKGRNKVHKMANKELKKLLHMGAVSARKNCAELREYYERKVAEGKHPMNVLNAIRNKIALRAVAVINSGQPYVDRYKLAA
jgi:transposase